MNIFVCKRIFSKIIDFIVSFSVISGIVGFLSIPFSGFWGLSSIFAFSAIAVASLECLFHMLSQPTVGECICGLQIQKKLSFKESALSSTVSLLKFLALSIPMINIYLAIKWYKQEPLVPNYFENSAQPRKFKRIIASVLISLVSFFGLLNQDCIEINAGPGKITKLFKKNLEWISFAHPENLWVAQFPKLPISQEITLNLPDKTVPQVTVEEHIHLADPLSYTISAITLPDNLLSWGYKLVLKGSLDVVSSNIPGSKVLSKRIFKEQNLPMLEYRLDSNGIEKTGRLILYKNILYKIEVSYPKGDQEIFEDEISKFLSSIEINA